MKFIFIISGIIAILLVYHFATTVRFKDDQAQISSLYCSLFASSNLPKDPVIFVPGIKGSRLEKDGVPVWLRLADVLRQTSPLSFASGDGVVPNGIFTRLSIIPFFFEYRPYQRIAAQLACAPNAYVFSYDWRGYPQDNVKRLAELVKRVTQETGKKPSIIAHSMGGLITHGYLKQNTSTIEKVVYVSVPFVPGVSYFDDVNDGAPVGLNKIILSKEALITQPASFLLMPHYGSNMYDGVELMNASVWSDRKFGAFKDGKADVKLVAKSIRRVQEFHDVLDQPKNISNQVRIIVGECIETIHKRKKDGQIIKFPGDGRVAKESAYPTDRIKHLTESSFCVSHDKQMDNKEIIEDIFAFLNEG